MTLGCDGPNETTLASYRASREAVPAAPVIVVATAAVGHALRALALDHDRPPRQDGGCIRGWWDGFVL